MCYNGHFAQNLLLKMTRIVSLVKVVPVVGVVVVIVVVGSSASKAYPKVALASASTLSGSVARTLKGGEGLLVASSL